MAPPPLPPDYGGGNQSSNTAQNEMMDMGWSVPTAASQPNTTANTDDDWGNTGWGMPGGNTAANKPPENNFQQAGGNAHSSSSGINNDFTSSKTSNSAANTNQVTLLQALCCFVVIAWENVLVLYLYTGFIFSCVLGTLSIFRFL